MTRGASWFKGMVLRHSTQTTKSGRLYSVLGPYSIVGEVRSGRLQATHLIRPDLVRHVTLAFRKQGKMLPAVRAVADMIQQLVRSWDDQLTEP
jgi:hypothetical protein